MTVGLFCVEMFHLNEPRQIPIFILPASMYRIHMTRRLGLLMVNLRYLGF